MKRIDKLEQTKLATTKTWAQTAAQNALPPSLLSKNSSSLPVPSSIVSSAAGPPETRREERDIVMNTNTNDNKQGHPRRNAGGGSENVDAGQPNVGHVGSGGAARGEDWGSKEAAESGQWVNSVGPRASIAVATYGVIVDGIRVDTANLDNQKYVIEEFQRQNCGVLTPERNIASLRWLTKPKRHFCSLVIEFTEATAYNAVVGAQELF
ncbi:MAG: hypothetical protein Q9182_004946 [Xanthomendoza sp. 2 TL-2023]